MVASGSRLVLAAFLLALCGCGLGYLNPNYLMPGERRLRIQNAARQYTNMLRFGYLDRAAVFVEPELRAPFLELFGGEGPVQVRFTGLDVIEVELGPERDQAVVHVSARVYRLPSVREEVLVEAQSWRYDPNGMRWLISPDFELYRQGPGRRRARASAPAAVPTGTGSSP